jgi:XTP/dITP diphosphohydrolase
MEIILATQNDHKLQEVRDILGKDIVFSIVSAKEKYNDNTDIDEHGSSFEENSLIKAYHYYNLRKVPVLADDSGLEIDFLDKKPGLHSSRFLVNLSYKEKCKEVLKLLKDAPFEKRTARFICSACYINNGIIFFSRGIIKGYIGYEYKGSFGFGYDPIFYLPECNKTLAEIPEEEKNKISHRALAFSKLKKYLTDRF